MYIAGCSVLEPQQKCFSSITHSPTHSITHTMSKHGMSSGKAREHQLLHKMPRGNASYEYNDHLASG